jgi:hypothetical protein
LVVEQAACKDGALEVSLATRTLITWSTALCLSLVGSSAWAQATRTWVSGVGDDANPCSRTAPCKTWAGAISKTAAGGEIDAMDPGGFGAVTITKSITLDGRGTMASILVGSGNGINISAGATDVVHIRNMTINGGASTAMGMNGIKFNTGAALHVEDVQIYNCGTQAIEFKPAAAATLYLKNVVVSNNVGGVIVGGIGQAVIGKSVFFTSGSGLRTTDGAKATVFDSVFAGNATHGLLAEGTSVINMDRGLIANNGVGVRADSSVRLSDVMVGHNTTGLMGNVTSFGNNRVNAGNSTNGAPSATIQQQ